jgi:UDP-N-acetylmuramoylalanine-D-glutamate ligase
MWGHGAKVTGSSRPVVMITSGDGKGRDYAPLKDAVAKHAAPSS